MSTYSEQWLALREPVDSASRCGHVSAAVAEYLHGPVEVVDMGAGTGANARCLAPRLAGPQHWRLLDHDAGLLRRAASECSVLHAADGRAVTVSPEQIDLASFDWAEVAGSDLITASALLDLVGEQWIDALVEAAGRMGCCALFALSYDGRIEWSPEDADDELVRVAFNEHQRGQVHFGEPTLGPAAGFHAAGRFSAAGFEVVRGDSAWRLGADEMPLLAALIDGWVAAATEQMPERSQRITDWAERRRKAVAEGRARVLVGHLDFAAMPAREPAPMAR